MKKTKEIKKRIFVIADNAEVIGMFFNKSKTKVNIELSRLRAETENAQYTLVPISYNVPISRFHGSEVDGIWVLEPVTKNEYYYEIIAILQERPPYRYFKENTIKYFKFA